MLATPMAGGRVDHGSFIPIKTSFSAVARVRLNPSGVGVVVVGQPSPNLEKERWVVRAAKA